MRLFISIMMSSSLLCLNSTLLGQKLPEVSIKNTEFSILTSKVNSHDYDIKVYLPAGYENEDKSYPVVYILDADYNFGMVCYGTRHLTINKDIPDVILVGIGNISSRRVRDYTPTKTSMSGSGGANQFIEFLKQELIPSISSTYRVNDDRTIVGHSLGGLFAYYCLFNSPDLFKNYLAVSPSLWYDNEFVFKQEESSFSSNKVLPSRIYSAVGELETRTNGMYHEMVQEHSRFTKQLQGRTYPQLKLKAETLPEENHHSIFPRAFMNGMRFLFEETYLKTNDH